MPQALSFFALIFLDSGLTELHHDVLAVGLKHIKCVTDMVNEMRRARSFPTAPALVMASR
jgi:hypothetical protein